MHSSAKSVVTSRILASRIFGLKTLMMGVLEENKSQISHRDTDAHTPERYRISLRFLAKTRRHLNQLPRLIRCACSDTRFSTGIFFPFRARKDLGLRVLFLGTDPHTFSHQAVLQASVLPECRGGERGGKDERSSQRTVLGNQNATGLGPLSGSRASAWPLGRSLGCLVWFTWLPG